MDARNLAQTTFGSLDSFGAGIDACTPMTSTEPRISPPGPRDDQFIERFEGAFRAEVDAFIRLVSGMDVNLTPPRDGLVAIQVAQAAAESIRAGSIIDLG
jgi:myo-inositol 2-dehydrogenase/D-chiro-inositol 1-dehydrogenase